MKTADLNGTTIFYTDETVFLIQVSESKNPKSRYKTKYRIVGNFDRAFLHYQGINIGNGYKKRFLIHAVAPSQYSLAKVADGYATVLLKQSS